MRSTASETETSLVIWDPVTQLKSVRGNEVRYSLGLLRGNPNTWFPSLANHWLPLFHAIGIDVRLVAIERELDFPEALSRISPFEVDGEISVIGCDEPSLRAIVDAVSPGCTGLAADVLFEYLERRLLTSLSKSWAGREPLHCYYISTEPADSAEIVASFCLVLEIGGESNRVWLGVGPRLAERLDQFSRVLLNESHPHRERVSSSESTHERVAVEVTTLAVPPALLIDYLRPGTTIDLQTPAGSGVLLRIGSFPWAQGELRYFNGKYAVEIASLDVPHEEIHPGTTRVSVEIAEAELDPLARLEHSQVGAIVLTKTSIGETCSVVISGEHVASGVLAIAEGRLVLNILPK